MLLHGFPDSKRLWVRQVPALVEAGFQVIVPDQRGYGASDKPAEVDAYGHPVSSRIDVTAILDALSIERGPCGRSRLGRSRRVGDRVLRARACRSPRRLVRWPSQLLRQVPA